MNDQDKDLKDQTPEDADQEGQANGEQPEGHEVSAEHPDRLKETTEKIWGSTRNAWTTATFKANQYKKLVQKKIDISALHKKINSAHGDLGKLIDDLRAEGKKNIMNLGEVKEILTRIDDLKTEAVTLEEEVEKIKTEEAPLDVHDEEHTNSAAQ